MRPRDLTAGYLTPRPLCITLQPTRGLMRYNRFATYQTLFGILSIILNGPSLQLRFWISPKSTFADSFIIGRLFRVE